MSETTAKVMKKKPMAKGGKGKMRHMMLEPAENGVVSTMSHESEDGSPYGGPKTKTVHPTMAHMVKHMKANMAGCFPSKGGDGDGGADDGDADDKD